MRKLALLDVDGTLTDTVDVDLRCYLDTLSALFGFSAAAEDYDWKAIPHATDPGLLRGAFEQSLGRPPSGREAALFRQRFLLALERAAGEDPAAFRPIHGAGELLAALEQAADWDFCVATGCWAESARLKLDLAGLGGLRRPAATASDAVSREEIFGLALERASGAESGTAAVLVGDGDWDAVTASNLGLPFVGVARGRRAASLRRLGAVAVLPDFRDLGTALGAMEQAASSVPKVGRGAGASTAGRS